MTITADSPPAAQHPRKVLALPSLAGRRGTIVIWIYRVFGALVALILAGNVLAYGVHWLRDAPAMQSFGFQAKTHGSWPVADVPYGPAAAAGLKQEDLFLAVNGQSIGRRANVGDVGRMVAKTRGDVLTLQVEGGRKEDQPRTLTLKRIPGNIWFQPEPQTNFPNIVVVALLMVQGLLPGLVLLGASFILYRRRPRDPQAMLLAFSFLPLCLFDDAASWCTFILHVPIQVFDFVNSMGTPLIFLAMASFPDGRFTSRWSVATLVTFWITEFVVLVGNLTGAALIVRGLQPLLFVAIIVMALASMLVPYRKAPPGLERQQLKWALAGAAVMALTVIAWAPLFMIQNGMLLPAWGRLLFNSFKHIVFFTALPIGLMVSVLRYRLYDSESVITRSAVFVLLSVVLLAIFTAFEGLLQNMGMQAVSSQFGSFTGAVAATLTAGVIAPVHARIKAFSERHLRKDLYHLREQLPALVGDMRETTDLEAIGQAAIERVKMGVRATDAVLIVGDMTMLPDGDEREAVDAWRMSWKTPATPVLNIDKTDPMFPLRVPLHADGVGVVGWLLVGPRPDGSFYSKGEREVLSKISDPLARAIAIAGRREANHSMIAERIADLEARIAHLTAPHPPSAGPAVASRA